MLGPREYSCSGLWMTGKWVVGMACGVGWRHAVSVCSSLVHVTHQLLLLLKGLRLLDLGLLLGRLLGC